MAEFATLSFNEQKQLLALSEEQGIPFFEILYRYGYTYDSLIYELSSHSPATFVPIEELPYPLDQSHSIPAISFFSGSGGLDIGFTRAGFQTLASIEINEDCCNTLRLNDKNKIVFGPPNFSGDLTRHEENRELLLRIGVRSPFEGVFYGGPPCQPFSIASSQRFSKSGSNFKRLGFEDKEKGNLIFDYIWYIKKFRPRFFLIENVEGIVAFDAKSRIVESLKELEDSGYTISRPQIMNAAFYGVPQKRLRWILIGCRNTYPFSFPIPNIIPTPCGAVFSKSLAGLPNHVTRKHSAQSIRRYMRLEIGQRDKLGRIDRLDPTLPSKTVIAGGTKGGGRSHLHPYCPRTLSVRECARLQTFPDNYIFTGSTARQFTQVGNAVPPLLAYKLALSIKESLIQPILKKDSQHIILRR